FVFLFDRYTGEPLFPIEDRPVPPSEIPGEQAAPSQPFPSKPPPFCRQAVNESDLTELTPKAHEEVLARFRTYRAGPAFTPPSLEGSVVVPGFHGGATWSGAAVDPTTGIIYVNSNEQPNVITLAKAKSPGREPYTPTGYLKFLDPDG